MNDTTQPAQPASAATLTPVAAQAEREFLMQDGAFRDKAMNPKSREWGRLLELDQVINRDALAQDEPPAQQVQTRAQQGQVAMPPAPSYERPPSPSDYELAPIQGLVSEQQAETEWRAGMHAAGVDRELAAVAYMVAGDAALRARTPEQADRELEQAGLKLQSKWGAQYQDNAAVASKEAKRIFEALPASLKAGADFETFLDKTGLGRSATVIEALYERAAARNQQGGART